MSFFNTLGRKVVAYREYAVHRETPPSAFVEWVEVDDYVEDSVVEMPDIALYEAMQWHQLSYV